MLTVNVAKNHEMFPYLEDRANEVLVMVEVAAVAVVTVVAAHMEGSVQHL